LQEQLHTLTAMRNDGLFVSTHFEMEPILDLKAYLERIEYQGVIEPTLEVLIAIHRQHLFTIPYENVDVQLQRTLDLDRERIFTKLVEEKRGGWCYEMNGLLYWVLQEIGFEVTRVSGGVTRSLRGDDALGNHLVLLVDVNEEAWIADTGFGDGVIDPIPLKEGAFRQRGFDFKMERLDDGYWRFHNHQHGAAPSFDFMPQPANEILLEEKCEYLQTSDESPFVMAFVAQRLVEAGYEIQLGKIAKFVTPTGVEVRELASEDEFVERMGRVFGIYDSELHTLWPKICYQHETYFQPQAKTV
jgi:N-hydroxyarylamine O-acetyltransferase